MIKILTILFLLLSVGACNAGEIVIEDTNIYVFDTIESTIEMSNRDANYNRTICINSTVVEGEIKIRSSETYELEYTFLCDINDSSYVSRIVTLKQTNIDGGWFAWDTLKRNLTIDGILIHSYIAENNFFYGAKDNTLYYSLIDNEIKFGSEVFENQSLAFTQLNYNDQYSFIDGTSALLSYPASHKYISIALYDDISSSGSVTGLTGIFYNAFGDTFLTDIPIVGGVIANIGKAIQALLFLPLSIIQFMFNLIFTVFTMLKNDWWYAILLLEIVCILPALAKDSFPDMMSTYIGLHIKIFTFFYEVVILNTINLIMRMIEIIRNMFRI